MNVGREDVCSMSAPCAFPAPSLTGFVMPQEHRVLVGSHQCGRSVRPKMRASKPVMSMTDFLFEPGLSVNAERRQWHSKIHE